MAVRSRLAHLPVGLLASAALAVPAGVLGAVFAGPAGLAGALGAVAAVAASFVISTLAVAWADRRDPSLTLPVALATYILKVIVIGVVGFAIARGHATWHEVTGWTVLAATLTWVTAQAWWSWHTPRPYVVLPPAPTARRHDPNGDGPPPPGGIPPRA